MRVQPCGWALSRNTEGPRFHGAREVCWEALQQMWRRNSPTEKRDNLFFFAGDLEQVKQADKHIHNIQSLIQWNKIRITQKELWLELPSPQGLDLTEFKSIHITLWVMMYFPACNTFPTDATLLASLYSVPFFPCKCSDNLHFLVPPVKNFTARTCQSMFIGSNYPHSLYIALVRSKFLRQLLPESSYFVEETPERLLPRSRVNHFLFYVSS